MGFIPEIPYGEPLPPDEPRPPTVHKPTGNPSGPPEPPIDEPTEKIVVRLADGKERKIVYIATTTYWSHEGKPISGQQFMDQLFGDLGDMIKDEEELRSIWSDPVTRANFMRVLQDRGYDTNRLEDMKRLIDAPNSDIFDVLAYVKFTLDPLARTERAENARRNGLDGFEDEMKIFLDAVLTGYEIHGAEELELSKISDFLKIKYGGTNGARQVLGDIPIIERSVY